MRKAFPNAMEKSVGAQPVRIFHPSTAVRREAGAATGALLIGEIASDDAGNGAAWGALADAVIARRRTEQAKAQTSQRVEQQSQQAQHDTAEQIENFKKAFSVCLEAKGYMVKF
jgi:thioredoxin-like negative regulator of GroEL